MDLAHASQRLSHHANAAEGDSFTFALWQAARQSHPPELKSLFDDVLSCFEAINHGLNTERPSEAASQKADVLPRSLVTDVSFILSEGWSYHFRWASARQFTPEFRAELGAMLLQIAIAWDAILAGDINDIREHVRTEYSATEYDLAAPIEIDLAAFAPSKNPFQDFLLTSEIVEITISRYSEPGSPSVNRKLTVTFQSGTSRRRFAFINPEPLAELSGLMDACEFRLLDRRTVGDAFIEFGRYWLEYREDDDAAPRYIQADRFEELNDDEPVTE